MPVLAVIVLLLLGFGDALFGIALYINDVYFSPVHFIFGDDIVPIHEFGPVPGIKGHLYSFIFYVIVSYLLANAVGVVVGKLDDLGDPALLAMGARKKRQ